MSAGSNPQVTNQPSPSMALLQIIHGYRVAQLVNVAAKLGLADLLKDGPKSSDDLAQLNRAHPRALYRALRALASFGIFAENEDGKFELTSLAQPLQSGVPGSVRSVVLYWCSDWWWRPWGELHYSVMTGKPSLDHVFGMGSFEHKNKNQEASQAFDEAMTDLTNQSVAAVMAVYDFSGISKIVDVGGGKGALISSILKAYSSMYGCLVDLPVVIEKSRGFIEVEDLAARCEVVGGDFFKSVPDGGDCYILQKVIHNWDNNHAGVILKNCRKAMGDNGRLLLVEMVIPPGNTQHPSKLFDIMMLVCPGGLERSEAEYRDLFDAASFRLTKIVPTQSPISIIEGTPV